MTPQNSESADRPTIEVEIGEPAPTWFGFERSIGLGTPATGTPEDRAPVTVQRVPGGTWNSDHVERLRSLSPLSGRDTSGLVPVADITGDPVAGLTVVSLRTDAPRFQDRLDFRTPPSWNEVAGIALAASLAVEKGHSLGLRHGALHPNDVVVSGDELAIAGMGLSLGGTPETRLETAPEVADSGVPTVAGDVFSLGKLLEAGTGGDRSTPAAIAAVIADATAENVVDRIPTAQAFADRLRAAAGDASRTYRPMSFAESTLFRSGAGRAAGADAAIVGATTAEAAETAAPVEPSPSGSRRVLPWVVGAGLAGLVGFALWAAASDGTDDSSVTTTSMTTTTTEQATTSASTQASTTVTTSATTATTASSTPTTTAPSTTTITSTTTTSPFTTTITTTTTAPSTTAAPTTTPTTTVPLAAVPADDAGLELLHGLPAPSVDVYTNGQLLVEGFEPGQIAGPLNLLDGEYEFALFAATDDAAASQSDRDDTALVSGDLIVDGKPATLVVAADAEGLPAVVRFAEDLRPTAAGDGRITIRNPTEVAVIVGITPISGGESISEGLGPRATVSADLAAGDLQIQIEDQSGAVLIVTIVSNPEGNLTTGTFLIGADGEGRLLLQRISGLESPPDGIPTGDSGLLPGPETPYTGLALAAIAATSLFVLVGRQRLGQSR